MTIITSNKNSQSAPKHLFVMDPLEKLELALDSSLRLARALIDRSHEVWICNPRQITWLVASGQAHAHCLQASANQLEGENLVSVAPKPKNFPLASFDVIHMRIDPPFDQGYLSTTWMLDSAKLKNPNILILNSPSGLRSVNEKISIMQYPQFCSQTLVTSDTDEIIRFCINECTGDAILKPLHLYGGKGILRIQEKDPAQILKFLRSEQNQSPESKKHSTPDAWWMVQPFNPDIYKGEVRAFTVNGKALAWCLKRPENGSFMANSSFGSTRHIHQPTDNELKIVTDISCDLRERYGIYVIGFDLIGEKVSEINVTSPRLLSAEKDQTAYFIKFADEICSLIGA